MIVDVISRLDRYASIDPSIAWIVGYLENNDVSKLPVGRHHLTPGVDLIREDYLSKPADQCQFESHEKYADLQWVLAGTEAIGYKDKSQTAYVVTSPYSLEKDVEKQSVKNYDIITLQPNQFALVFPAELHMPKIQTGDAQMIQKAVFKIRLQEEQPWQKS